MTEPARCIKCQAAHLELRAGRVIHIELRDLPDATTALLCLPCHSWAWRLSRPSKEPRQ